MNFIIKSRYDNHDKTKEKIKEIAEKVNGTVRKSYSGRGMYGATCWGIVCESDTECMEVAGSKGLFGAKVDNMGLSYIVYWEFIK